MFKNFHKYKYRSGMTLVELIVVIAIFMIILGLTIFDYSSFKSTIAIQNLADDIALSIRKAQTYALGSKNNLTQNLTARGFGVHFVIKPPLTEETFNQAGSNKSFVIFSDIKVNNGYDYNLNDAKFTCGDAKSNISVNNECIDLIEIKSDAKIIGIKIGEGSTSYNLKENESLDITFVRPNPDALFCYKEDPKKDKCKYTESHFSVVTLTVASSKVDENGKNLYPKNIIIRNTGQISVK